jgi:hypothetical protein
MSLLTWIAHQMFEARQTSSAVPELERFDLMQYRVAV